MTLTELKVWMKCYRDYKLTESEFLEKVEQYSSASNNGNSIVSGFVPPAEMYSLLSRIIGNKSAMEHISDEWQNAVKSILERVG